MPDTNTQPYTTLTPSMNQIARGTTREKEQPVAQNLGMSAVFEDLKHFIDDLSLSEDVVNYLIPTGTPHAFEHQLWDYKLKVPTVPASPDIATKTTYRAEIGSIIKDVVAFHNAYGGYLVFGVADKGADRLVGCDEILDCGELTKGIFAATGTRIECLFKQMSISAPDGTHKPVGLLLIPKRTSGASPVRFLKEGPEKAPGQRVYNKEIYVRIGDECRPATNTDTDWSFLHSDRASGQVESSWRKRTVQSSLPARDPDLVQFVGRELALKDLRRWISDERNPTRLITGIGGLGKTTLAFRFAEEVVKTAAGEIEWVIWLTAKEQTYSALRGKLVPTGQVDFSNLRSLYEAILRTFSFDVSRDDDATDDITLDDLADRIVEALGFYSSLIVVDDIDSLSPEEQRETVAALSAIVIRTVGRDFAPSRVLFTSRIDQGLSPTAVQKINGLDEESFRNYLFTLCEVFGLSEISEKHSKTIYNVTSGSPLFASSIVRLIKLGENLNDVLDTWRGQEGEDVRRFAFEREIKRLDVPQGKLLYAVLLLRETSISDLATVLDFAPSVVRDRVSELQAYHLLATATEPAGKSTLYAPADLLPVKELLREHLGVHGQSVEEACAAAEKRSSSTNSSIGAGIREIVRLWESDRHAEAVIASEALRVRFPKSGDVACLLGASYLKTSPSRPKEADRELMRAYAAKCSRPELIPYIIRAKTETEDWSGLYDLTKGMFSRETGRDIPLSAFIAASKQLLRTAQDRSDYRRAAEIAISGVERISAKMQDRLDKPFFASLTDDQYWFATQYVAFVERTVVRPGDALAVFDAIARLGDADVVLVEPLRRGLSALQRWWSDVEQRPVVDRAAADILARQLRRLERLGGQLSSYETRDLTIQSEMVKVSRDLAYRAAKLLG